MALTDKLTAIGNAIRAKTGGTDLIPLADMPAAIESIPSGGGSPDSVTLEISGRGNESYCYVQIGDTKYYSAQIIENIPSGTLIYCDPRSSKGMGAVSVNETIVANGIEASIYYYCIAKDTTIDLHLSGKANSINITC